MKSTDNVRKVDDLGRIVIPIELRRIFGINERDPLEVSVDDDRITLKKYTPSLTCQITGEISDDNLTLANGRLVLSKVGAEIVLNEIKEYLEKV